LPDDVCAPNSPVARLLLVRHVAYKRRTLDAMTAATKSERIHLRLTDDQKATITAAAEVLGRSVSDFAIQTTVERAHEVLADQRIFHVPADRWAEFSALMDAPVEPNRGLADLYSKPSVFKTR
jgi:uncharacterized protein (DUF1778 family)